MIVSNKLTRKPFVVGTLSIGEKDTGLKNNLNFLKTQVMEHLPQITEVFISQDHDAFRNMNMGDKSEIQKICHSEPIDVSG